MTTAIMFMPLLFLLIFIGFGILCYIISALALYRIAKVRNVSGGVMAFFPIVDSYLLGKIGDDVNAERGKKSHFGKILLITNIVAVALTTIMLIIFIILSVNLTMNEINHFEYGYSSGNSYYNYNNYDSNSAPSDFKQLDSLPKNSTNRPQEQAAVGVVGMYFLLLLVVFPISIVNAVFTYMALHKIFDRYDRENAILYIVLSVLFGVVQPFFLLSVSNKAIQMHAAGHYYNPNGYNPNGYNPNNFNGQNMYNNQPNMQPGPQNSQPMQSAPMQAPPVQSPPMQSAPVENNQGGQDQSPPQDKQD